jgi:hypothetical protein
MNEEPEKARRVTLCERASSRVADVRRGADTELLEHISECRECPDFLCLADEVADAVREYEDVQLRAEARRTGEVNPTVSWREDGDRWRARLLAAERSRASWEVASEALTGDVVVTLRPGPEIAYTEPYEEMGTCEYGAWAAVSQYGVGEDVAYQEAWGGSTWLLYAVYEEVPSRAWSWGATTQRLHSELAPKTSLVLGEAVWGLFIFDARSLAEAQARGVVYASVIARGPEDSADFYSLLDMPGHWAVAFPRG